MKKIAIVFLSVCFALSCLAACGGEEAPEPPVPTESAGDDSDDLSSPSPTPSPSPAPSPSPTPSPSPAPSPSPTPSPSPAPSPSPTPSPSPAPSPSPTPSPSPAPSPSPTPSPSPAPSPSPTPHPSPAPSPSPTPSPSPAPSPSPTPSPSPEPVVYTITLDACGGTVSPAFVSVTAGAVFALPEPARTGYAFAGWRTADGQPVTDGVYSYEGDLALYAAWEAETHTVAFVTNGGAAVSPLSGPTGSAILLPTPVREGMLFVGWYLSADFSGDAASFTEMPPEDATLYAKWESPLLYTVANGAVTITGWKAGAPQSVLNIPAFLGGMPVTAIADYAFRGGTFTAVVLPEGLLAIGSYAFADTAFLSAVILPDSLTRLGSHAFSGSGVVAVTIGENVEEMGDRVFAKTDEEQAARTVIRCKAMSQPGFWDMDWDCVFEEDTARYGLDYGTVEWFV